MLGYISATILALMALAILLLVILPRVNKRRSNQTQSRPQTQSQPQPQTPPAPTTSKESWFSKFGWVFVVILLMAVGIYAVNSFQSNPPQPTNINSVQLDAPMSASGYLMFQHPERDYLDRFAVQIEKPDADTLVIKGSGNTGKSFILEAKKMAQELFVGRCQWSGGWSDFSIRLSDIRNGKGTIDIPLHGGGQKTVDLILSPR